MPYATLIPGAFIDLDVVTPVLHLGQNLVLNNIISQPSLGFSHYDPYGDADLVLEAGDAFRGTDSNSATIIEGFYGGTATLCNAAVTTNVLFVGSATVQLNPIHGDLMVAGNGAVSFISEFPLDNHHISVTISLTLAGIPLPAITANISGVAAALSGIPGIGALLTPTLNTVQSVVNTVNLNIGHDIGGTLEIDPGQVICFAAGTLITTPSGSVPIEDLSVGQPVCTRDNGDQIIRWIGSTRITAAGLRRNPALRPIRIRTGALAPGIPASDLLVSPQHRVLVRSRIALRMFGSTEVLVAAKQLVGLAGVEPALDLTDVTYFHVLFDNHQIILSNGAETESLFVGPQALAAVGAEARAEILQLFPEFAAPADPMSGVRPLIPGRKGRNLASRHRRNRQVLVMPPARSIGATAR